MKVAETVLEDFDLTESARRSVSKTVLNYMLGDF